VCPRFPNLRAVSLRVCDFFSFFSSQTRRLADLLFLPIICVPGGAGRTSCNFVSAGFWRGVAKTYKTPPAPSPPRFCPPPQPVDASTAAARRRTPAIPRTRGIKLPPLPPRGGGGAPRQVVRQPPSDPSAYRRRRRRRRRQRRGGGTKESHLVRDQRSRGVHERHPVRSPSRREQRHRRRAEVTGGGG
jgi:hypothetical protein